MRFDGNVARSKCANPAHNGDRKEHQRRDIRLEKHVHGLGGGSQSNADQREERLQWNSE